MGNESSKLKGLVVDKTAVEANDFWTLYNAESPTTSNEDGRQFLSIFQGEILVNGQLWLSQSPIERSIKNLRIYRHPYILKYVSTWEKNGQKHLATDRVSPLVALLPTQNDIQVCLGLRTILCSLIFLIEKAMARHLNICVSSIYVTESGSWRLAGFEYVWKNKDITKTLLNLANSFRYQQAIDPSEVKDNNIDNIEQYAFATLCEEILSKCTKNEVEIPYVQEFREYCATHLKHKNTQMRPKLSAVLLHPYFNHEFVLIHSFLFELPLKSVQEKKEFFANLIDRLRYFNEEVVGSQLATSLLSRMVLLDPTAQFCVTPYVLRTRADHSPALFSPATYTRYLMPHIKKMFRLRDAQIRLILLEYFMEYIRLLPKDELQDFILPHLQAGMLDTNDVLVAKTLRCLADLVPILGSTIVLGGNRERLFSDGRPQAAVPESTSHWVEPRSITPVLGNSVEYMVSSSPLPDSNVELSSSQSSLPQALLISSKTQLEMPQRLSPDGGEDDETMINVNCNFAEENQIESKTEDFPALKPEPKQIEINANVALDEEEAWSDWETDELQRLNCESVSTKSNTPEYDAKTQSVLGNGLPSDVPLEKSFPKTQSSLQSIQSQTSLTDSFHTTHSSTSSASSLKPQLRINDDLNAFDITVKNIEKTGTPGSGNEFDFFKDMEPVININSNGFSINEEQSNALKKNAKQIDDDVVIDSNRFAAVATSSDVGASGASDGWGTDDVDVNEIENGGFDWNQ